MMFVVRFPVEIFQNVVYMKSMRFVVANCLAVLLLVTSVGCSSRSALVGAARSGNVEITKILLDQGMNPDDHVYIGDRPLHVAIERNHTDVVKLLVKRGADVNARNSTGESPLIIAIRSRVGNTLEIIKFLVSNGADVNASSIFGKNALGTAAKHGDPEIVKYLLANGATTKNFGN